MNRVEHSVYGQGLIINQVNDTCTVKFDNGLTKDVSRNELLDVLLS